MQHIRLTRADCDRHDATDAIQKALDTPNVDAVTVEYTGRPWIVRPLFIRRDGRSLRLNPGVAIEAKPGAFKDIHDCLLSVLGQENVTIEGHGATLRMRKEDYTGTKSTKGTKAYTPSEWRHGVSIRGSRSTNVSGITVESSGGDGIYIGAYAPGLDYGHGVASNVVQVHDCALDQNHRAGLSVVSGTGIHIERTTASNTKGTAPQCGFIVEPANPTHEADVSFVDCKSGNDASGGFYVNLARMKDPIREARISFRACRVFRSGGSGIRIRLFPTESRGSVVAEDCLFENTAGPGLHLQWTPKSNINARFDNCVWKNAAYIRESAFRFDLSDGEVQNGTVTFSRAMLFAALRRRDLLNVQCVDGMVFPGISGDVAVYDRVGGTLPIPELPNVNVITEILP